MQKEAEMQNEAHLSKMTQMQNEATQVSITGFTAEGVSPSEIEGV